MCRKMSKEDHSQSIERIKLKKYLSDSIALIKNDFSKIKYILLAAGIYILVVKRFLHKMCPFVLLTGYPCPLCGMTRAFFAFLRGDFKEAWRLHPFVFVIPVVLIIYVIWRYILHKKVRHIGEISVILVSALCILYLYRIVFCFDGVPPMSYYDKNLINVIRNGLNL